MLAIAAVLRNEGYDGMIELATTKYVASDSSANFAKLAEELGVKAHVVSMDLSQSPFRGAFGLREGIRKGRGRGWRCFMVC